MIGWSNLGYCSSGIAPPLLAEPVIIYESENAKNPVTLPDSSEFCGTDQTSNNP